MTTLSKTLKKTEDYTNISAKFDDIAILSVELSTDQIHGGPPP